MNTVPTDVLSRSLVDSMPQMVWLSQCDGACEYLNHFGATYLGVTGNEVLGEAWQRVMHPDDLPIVRDRWRASILHRAPFEAEYRMRTAAGQYRWNLGRARPIPNGDGSVSRWVGTALDIEDRKIVERDLRDAKRQSDELLTLLNTLQTAAPVGFAFLSPEFRYLRLNDSLAATTGQPPEAHIGRTVAEMVPWLWASLEPHLRRVLGEQVPVTNVEIAANPPRHPGERHHWLVNGYPVFVNNELIGVGMLTIEVTEQRRLEEQLRHSQKMEAIGRLAGSIAHDFNNLLTAIVGNAELLLHDCAEASPSRSSLIDIQRAGRSAAAITSQLLTFSRRQVVPSAVLDPRDAIGTMPRLIQQAAGERVTVEYRLAPVVPCIRMDTTRFQQVLLNLVVNARDAMGDGGHLTIECRDEIVGNDSLALKGPKPGHYTVVAVTDTGTGMTPEVVARLFEPFFTTKPHGRGTGLGLPTAYGIVTQVGGHISVETRVGHGSRFTVYFPALAEQATLEPQHAATADSLRGAETILLVEDEETVRRMVREVLVRHGYTVLDAATSDQARMLEAHFSGEIHLLLTDLALPQADGRNLAAEIGARRRMLRVLYMSGYTAAAAGGHEALLPGRNFIGKPFGPVELLTGVKSALAA